ncbi:MAG TPA: DUF4870 domain-containing protein [Sedimentisphaerales bacterium]|nr:DUF4870 domain-containing protein [Sedimentisphaerales bacterium]
MPKNEGPNKADEAGSDESSAAPAKRQSPEASSDARRWAMFCHLAGLAWMMVWPLPIIGGVVATLIVWQIKKDDDPFIDRSGKQALNFQLSMLIYSAVLAITVIGVFLLPVVAVLNIVFTIIAAVRAGDGKHYSYPLSIEFIK